MKSLFASSAAFLAVACALAPCKAEATLVFFYDPDTGNVSLDTADTRSGSSYTYSLYLPRDSEHAFSFENVVPITSTQYRTAREVSIGEGSISAPFSGYFTIGNVLEPGIEESVWTTLFTGGSWVLGKHSYTDLVGQGRPPDAEFVYGQPDRPFDNRWDIVDPDELAWADRATLVYHEATGELFIDTTGIDGGHITTFTLDSNGAFSADEFTPFVDVPLTVGTEDTLFIAADAIEPGVYSLGRVLDAGLTESEFESLFTEASFIARVGFGGASFDFEADGAPMQFAFVGGIPEPSSLTVLVVSVGIAGLSKRA